MNRIFVFTSTGNSLHLARKIADGSGQTEILSIPFLMKQKKWSIEGDKTGFIFPCNYGTIPQLVRQFISGAEKINTNYIFAVVSSGGGTGIALKSLSQELKKRNQKLHYGRSTILVSNYMNGWYYNSIYPGQNEFSERMNKADQLCAEIISDIKAGRQKRDKISYAKYLVPVLMSPKRYRQDTGPWDCEYNVGDICNGCGICVKACPAGNIKIDNGKPEFSHNCLRCMGCVQLCPKQAFFIQGKPMNKKPYLHPKISKIELFDFHKNGIIPSRKASFR